MSTNPLLDALKALSSTRGTLSSGSDEVFGDTI